MKLETMARIAFRIVSRTIVFAALGSAYLGIAGALSFATFVHPVFKWLTPPLIIIIPEIGNLPFDAGGWAIFGAIVGALFFAIAGAATSRCAASFALHKSLFGIFFGAMIGQIFGLVSGIVLISLLVVDPKLPTLGREMGAVIGSMGGFVFGAFVGAVWAIRAVISNKRKLNGNDTK